MSAQVTHGPTMSADDVGRHFDVVLSADIVDRPCVDFVGRQNDDPH